jgi:nucleoside-diphosphate-sugar epimerase
MRVFLAGAGGAIGRYMVPRLVAGGHEVVAMTRSPNKVDALRDAGAYPVVADGLDRDAVVAAVTGAEPEVVVNQMTALADVTGNPRHFDEEFAVTNALRTKGTDHLLEGARAAGARRLIVQSYAGWPSARVGGPVKTEDDPLDPNPPASMRNSLDAMRSMERVVVEAEGIEGVVLRYGLDDAAAATVAALDHGGPGIYNVVDDEPAPVAEWLPGFAAAVGAKPPRHVPKWLGRLLAGEAAVSMMTEVRGSSNAKAKRELGWTLRYPSWRQGFRAEFAA